MIVLAADYVGYRIVKFLIESNETIDYLFLDSMDRGKYNNKIAKLFCVSHDTQIIHYENELQEKETLDRLDKLKPNLGILAWWPYILKGRILSIPNIGWLNLHPSFLPFNKGKHPSFWCLVDDTPCGVSIQVIDEGIDTGAIIARKKIDVSWEDTGKTIYEKCREEIIDLFKENFNDIKSNNLKRINQNYKEGTYHRSTEIDDIIKLDLNSEYNLRRLLNIIRGKIDPPAYFYDGRKKFSLEIKIKEVKENEQ